MTAHDLQIGVACAVIDRAYIGNSLPSNRRGARSAGVAANFLTNTIPAFGRPDLDVSPLLLAAYNEESNHTGADKQH